MSGVASASSTSPLLRLVTYPRSETVQVRQTLVSAVDPGRESFSIILRTCTPYMCICQPEGNQLKVITLR